MTDPNDQDAQPIAAHADTVREAQRERFGLLADNIRSSSLPTLLVGALYAAFYTHFNDLPETWLWWLVLVGLLGWRHWLLRGGENARRFPRSALYLTMFLIGLAWAAAPLLIVWLIGDALAFTAMLLAISAFRRRWCSSSSSARSSRISTA